MKKVVYSVTKVGRYENTKLKGVGFIIDSDLVIACSSKKGNPYIRVFEDCIKDCHPVLNAQNEFKGSHYEILEVEFEKDNGSTETREIEVSYYIWYKILD